jgi:Fur family transcriptional regulator, stress-responsive regulator
MSQEQEEIQRDDPGRLEPAEREEATISELVQRLRDRGWRLTAQRRVVAEVLAGEHVHLTADAVYGRAQRLLPEISLATVYNTLNELVDMGEVLEIATGDGPKRYDPNTTAAHHHLYCVGCGALRDVNPEGTDGLILPAGQQHGFELLDVDIVFRGRCPDCRSPAPAAASG